MTAPDLFPDGESGFALDLDFDDAENTVVLIIGLLIIVAALALTCFFWFDRPASAPTQHQPASWVPAPIHRERAFAILEQPQGGRP